MFQTVFFTTIRTIAIPYVAYRILSSGFVAESNALLIVCIGLTITVALSLLFQILRLFTNIILLKPQSAFQRFVTILIELASVAGFWYYYIVNFS
ncbi:MAG: hypothetical protein KatS3mg085_605 [Candidatus Dojkabacteria bacterium]|nr:MAG: hypothetical protein KatS3mg085_605 [Candidatus Dojkabacteria bacterium]